MYNLKIKSVIHDYEVDFTNNFAKSLDEELLDGDFIILDSKIAELYSQDLTPFLSRHKSILINANEQQKSYQGIIPVIQTLINEGFRKNHRLVAIGGGITQDITAFIASIMYRGVKWIFFPTTLLAQGDSCIGSKTSINFGEYKNQVGGFYPPNRIIIYPDFMKSLSDKEMKSGMGEMLHYFVVSGEADFRMYESNFMNAFNDKDVLAQIVAKSLEIKKGYIEKDEFDQNIRQVFNYGHSFGHAIESLTKYRIPHGIAVSYGMDMANYLSVDMGLVKDSVRREIRSILENIWKGFPLADIDVDTFIQALRKDKKNVGNQLGLILNKGYGQIFKQLIDVDKIFVDRIRQYFKDELNDL
ncbi:MAG: 3-dehydroquinate synthase [Bacteroidetes bacterium]|nr:3-dehydroquinate synthase [Bacteroidota bacterium]